MRLTALIPLLFAATPLVAQTDAAPAATHDLALTCLALWTTNLERADTGGNTADTVQEMVFFARVIAQKATPDDVAGFDTRFAEMLAFYRARQAEMDNPATRDEADLELTGSGKMCWFQALTAAGGPYEGQ